MTVKDAIIKEIDMLPGPQQTRVLTFVRFLKVGLADTDETTDKFNQAIKRTRKIARERGITDADIEREIQAVRGSGR
jgi:hypothetical protein